ncbi:MAG: NADH-quinone oxidoreductase subunit L [Armatimonadota bacterium]
MLQYVWLIPLLPAVAALINGAVGKRLPKVAVSAIACGSVGVSFLLALMAFRGLAGLPVNERSVTTNVYPWIPVAGFRATFGTLFDPLSAVMALVVAGVSFLIHIYSVGYMHDDPAYSRYFTYLNLFVGSMLILVLANNFVLMYVGWELVGLCSYLLIGFWFQRPSAAAAGKKAFVVNRIGDFGFALGIMLIFSHFGSVAFQDVFPSAHALAPGLATAITLLLFLGATGKSAQLPLYVWLPDAMEGPTPVSALIHAATMVTAGVYMVARCHALYQASPVSPHVVAWVGAVTALFAATIAVAQFDIKRVLAYSTISQLGYMFLGVGVGAYAAGVFHLMTHAFFKALLFLGAGSVMHALAGEVDMRRMGGLAQKLPVTHWTFLAGVLAISGAPLLSGFFSKDEILWRAWTYGTTTGSKALWLVGWITAGVTAFYMFRLFYRTFHGRSDVPTELAQHAHEAPPSMAWPLRTLAVLSVVGGWVGIPAVLQAVIPVQNVFDRFLEPVFADAHAGRAVLHHAPSAELSLMLLTLFIAAAGWYTAHVLYYADPERRRAEALARSAGKLYVLLQNKYYVDEIYQAAFVKPGYALARLLGDIFDVFVVDGIVNFTGAVVSILGEIWRYLQTGYVRWYAWSVLAGTAVLVMYLIAR